MVKSSIFIPMIMIVKILFENNLYHYNFLGSHVCWATTSFFHNYSIRVFHAFPTFEWIPFCGVILGLKKFEKSISIQCFSLFFVISQFLSLLRVQVTQIERNKSIGFCFVQFDLMRFLWLYSQLLKELYTTIIYDFLSNWFDFYIKTKTKCPKSNV